MLILSYFIDLYYHNKKHYTVETVNSYSVIRLKLYLLMNIIVVITTLQYTTTVRQNSV